MDEEWGEIGSSTLEDVLKRFAGQGEEDYDDNDDSNFESEDDEDHPDTQDDRAGADWNYKKLSAVDEKENQRKIEAGFNCLFLEYPNQ